MNVYWETFQDLALKFVIISSILSISFSLRYGVASFKKFGRWSQLKYAAPYAIYILIFILLFQFAKELVHESIYKVLLLPGFICLVLFFEKTSEVEIRGENVNLGGQIALWYYLGYLQLVLNPPDNDSQSIKNRIEQYEVYHNVKVASKKLFVLIPSSCYTPKEIPGLEICQNLKTTITDRSGNERKFDNPIYIINPDFEDNMDEPIRCAIEGATPLQTLHKMSSPMIAKIDENQRKEHLEEFYQELVKLVDKDPVCKEGCVLLNYDDSRQNFRMSDFLKDAIQKYG